MPSRDGWTALHIAAERGHYEIARDLVIAGADINASMLESKHIKHIPSDLCYDVGNYDIGLAGTNTVWEDRNIVRLQIF
jgi:ankyrin repeat protein